MDVNAIRTRIGIVFQSYNLFPHMTVMRNITLAPTKVLDLSAEDAADRAHQLLERFGLVDKADEYPDRLSGGQQQRVAIVRALAMQPDIMLLDEVTSALDPELVAEVLDVIRELATGGMTMLIATHEMGFARDIASRVCFLDEGVILEQGAPQQMFTRSAGKSGRSSSSSASSTRAGCDEGRAHASWSGDIGRRDRGDRRARGRRRVDRLGASGAARVCGSAWTAAPLPAISGSGGLEDVAATSPTDAWAVGHRYDPGDQKGHTLIEHHDGTSWTITPSADGPSAPQSELSGVSARTSTDAWAVGSFAKAEQPDPHARGALGRVVVGAGEEPERRAARGRSAERASWRSPPTTPGPSARTGRARPAGP